jgi:hypothetical protein
MEMADALVFENIAVLLKNCRFAVPYIKAKRLWKMPKGLTIILLTVFFGYNQAPCF